MPLQKQPPHVRHCNNNTQPTKRRPTQERRRTLQTISELSIPDGAQSDFSTFMRGKLKDQSKGQEGVPLENQIPRLGKRRSLPQYCSSPTCLQARASANEAGLRTSRSQHLRPPQGLRTTKSSTHEQGWNARREQARTQLEHAVTEQGDRPPSLEASGQFVPQSRFLRPVIQASQFQTKGRTGPHRCDQHLLRNSRSVVPLHKQSVDHGAPSKPAERFENASESSGRTSTDSSSHRSSRDRAVRRSRSGSSSDTSYASTPTPPVPVLTPPRMQRYYSMPSSYLQYNQAVSQTTKTAPMGVGRMSSLPFIRVEHVGPSPLDKKHTCIAKQRHQMEVQRARLESLAALTAQSEGPQMDHRSAFSTDDHRASLPSQRRRYSSNQGRPRSDSHLKPPPHYTPFHQQRVQANSKTKGGNAAQATDALDTMHHRVSLEQRTVPKRESLTQWKTEREEAKAEHEGRQRAKMKERVKRANEMELAREKELMEMGKGTAVVKEKEEEDIEIEKERGCFPGLWSLWRRKS